MKGPRKGYSDKLPINQPGHLSLLDSGNGGYKVVLQNLGKITWE